MSEYLLSNQPKYMQIAVGGSQHNLAPKQYTSVWTLIILRLISKRVTKPLLVSVSGTLLTEQICLLPHYSSIILKLQVNNSRFKQIDAEGRDRTYRVLNICDNHDIYQLNKCETQ